MPESEGGKKHIQKLEPDKSHEHGCVTKHEGKYKNDRCAYRWNGYNEMSTVRVKLYHIDFTTKKHGARLPYLYKEFMLGSAGGKSLLSNWRFANNPRENRTAWWFIGPNYKVAYFPYNHNYHHILPFGSIKQLTYEELRILQAGKYNLNDEKNMIILPCLDAYGIAMKLPAHPRNHDQYNKAVKTIVNEIKQKINDKTNGHKIEEDNVENFKTKLVNWQQRQFDVIVKYGEKLAAQEDPEAPSESNQIDNSPMAAAL